MKTNFKKGTKLLIVECRNSAKSMEGKIVEVLTNNGSGNYTVQDLDSSVRFNIYSNGNPDTFVEATKEPLIKYYKEKIANLKIEIELCEAEVDFYEKYDSMEEYVADKLIAISKTNDKDSLVKMLKTLKQTNFL